ncbi:hypothetical protein JQC92_12295 [Shewanella sp. 202IG2-18]|uniref:hypothetical protein n=1 Tax=Parashewanella hymeniacidonis TaxID=2807618 RepID=UPI001961F469|nr:hypothetical protein [Parashewanella hymeniacidonis]MBM7072802.1 hypothetical protein [Parashewanella hymeniacidonis]
MIDASIKRVVPVTGYNFSSDFPAVCNTPESCSTREIHVKSKIINTKFPSTSFCRKLKSHFVKYDIPVEYNEISGKGVLCIPKNKFKYKCMNNIDYLKMLVRSSALYDDAILLSIPSGHFVDIEDCRDYYKIVLIESNTLDKNIKFGEQLYKLETVSLVVKFNIKHSNEKNCLHIPMDQCSLVNPCVLPQVDYLTTAGLCDCYAVILWDKSSHSTIMAHIREDCVSKSVCNEMILKLTSTGTKQEDIQAIVIGGETLKMSYSKSYFNCIEKTLIESGIFIRQTFIGDNVERPSDILFELSNGNVYEYKVSENMTEYRLNLYEADKGAKLTPEPYDGCYLMYSDTYDLSELIPVSLSFH